MRMRISFLILILGFEFSVEVIVFRSLRISVVDLEIGVLLCLVRVMRGCLCFVRVMRRCLCFSVGEFLLLFFGEVTGSGRRWRRVEIFPVPNGGGLGRGGGVGGMCGGEEA